MPGFAAFLKVKDNDGNFVNFDDDKYDVTVDAFTDLQIFMKPITNPVPLELKVCYQKYRS